MIKPSKGNSFDGYGYYSHPREYCYYVADIRYRNVGFRIVEVLKK
jgi:hypothetical protein